MSLDLNTVDVDGAIREADAAVAGDTRADFFRKAAIGGGAAIGSATILGSLPELAAAKPSKKQDLKILNYALTLEYLEAEFYDQAVNGGALSGETLTLATLIRDHEVIHVGALRATIKKLGAKPVRKPSFDFKGTPNDAEKFINTAFVLENTGVRAYLGQAARLKSKALLNAAASIVTVEARHAAAVAVLLGESTPPLNANEAYGAGERSVTPYGAFDPKARMKKILGEVESTGFITG